MSIQINLMIYNENNACYGYLSLYTKYCAQSSCTLDNNVGIRLAMVISNCIILCYTLYYIMVIKLTKVISDCIQNSAILCYILYKNVVIKLCRIYRQQAGRNLQGLDRQLVGCSSCRGAMNWGQNWKIILSAIAICLHA